MGPLDLLRLRENAERWFSIGLDDSQIMDQMRFFLQGTTQTIILGDCVTPPRMMIAQILRDLHDLFATEHLQNAFIMILEHTEYPFDLDSVHGLRHAIRMRDPLLIPSWSA